MKNLFFLIALFSISLVYGQVDFDNYTPLVSKGKLPELISKSLEQKVQEDLLKNRSLSKSDEEVFVQRNQRGLSRLIFSGDMLFGDPITKYVNDVAKIILKANPSLNQDYQFYTLRSNVTNALCTDPGVIFVTTGLLSQVENEAQLAAVLSHEIVHKEEEHFEKSFSSEKEARQKSDSREKYIVQMSSHSKEAEFEADRLAIEIYKNAGYGKSGILSAFDVLMYSYLPFDEINLDKKYFQTDKVFIPNNYFPLKINEILAEDDYDDSKSTHPNIKKRREAVNKEAEKISGWKTKDFIVSDEKFNEVRTVSRFESVRNDLLAGHYSDALYSIYLLEKEYPKNKYLSFSKAQAWNGLVKAKVQGHYFDAVRKPKKVEGESHAMHYMLRKLKKEQLFAIALRMVQDEVNKFPEDEKIQAVRLQLLKNLASQLKFDLRDYDTLNFQKAIQRFESSKKRLESEKLNNSKESDSKKQTKGSKYDRIKNKKRSTSANYAAEDFDSTKFHIYALTDVVVDQEIKNILSEARDEFEKEEKEAERIKNLSKKERRKNSQSIENVILFQPKFIQKGLNSNNKYAKIYYESVNEVVDLATKKMKLNFSKVENEFKTVEDFNEMSFIENYLFQVFSTENPFPVEFDGIEKFRKKFNEEYGILFVGEYTKGRRSKRTRLTGALVNLKTGDTERTVSHFYRGKPKRMLVKGYIYDLISKLGQKND